jgi:hypothetical protein
LLPDSAPFSVHDQLHHCSPTPLPPAPSSKALTGCRHAVKQRRRGFIFRRQRSPQQLFSCQLCVHQPAQQAQTQELVTTGSKVWGLGAALPIAKLYDFAVYLNRQQAQRSPLAAQFGAQLAAAPRQDAFYHSLRASAAADLDFSLVVRAARSLPIRLVAAEYRRILRSRLAALGHDPGDAGLTTMLEAFRWGQLLGAATHFKVVRGRKSCCLFCLLVSWVDPRGVQWT